VGLRRGLRIFHRHADLEAAGNYGAAHVSNAWKVPILAGLVGLTALNIPPYVNHLLIIILLWSFAYTSWSIMGRFGLVSIGHGAFLGIGAYATALLWNYGHVSPWIGIPAALVLTAGLAALVGYPCFRFRVVGHYFALVTLALGEVVRLSIVAMRDYTGGSLGMTPRRAGEGNALYALQFADKRWFYLIALLAWVGGLYVWRRIDNSMTRYAMDAISEDETAAAAIGINVMREKMKITILSAVMIAFAGALFNQYQLYINPETVSGINISLQIVFAAVAGGMFTLMGPTVGAIFTIMLAELLRVGIGVKMVGLDNTIYGAMLIAFIIFLPNGIVGTALDWWKRGRARTTDVRNV
jgi:branched-chain amino acid transport system permease protein